MIYIFPVFYGEGYDIINMLINGNYPGIFYNSPLYDICANRVFFFLGIAGIILLKVFATTFTTASGGIGGVFAPTLFIGAFTGFFVSAVTHHLLGVDLPYVNFILAGMAGVMTGVMQAPMSAMFLIAELSGGYTLLIPLMITAACSYLCVNPFEKYSVYTRPLAEKGNLKTHNKDKFALRKLQWKDIIDTDIISIPVHSSLRTYTDYIAHCKRNLFVVIDDNNLFSGLLVMDDHRDIIFRQELYDLVHVENTDDIKELLVKQVSSSVKWNQTLERFIADGVDEFVEIGPGHSLTGFVKKIDRSLKTVNIDTLEDLNKYLEQ